MAGTILEEATTNKTSLIPRYKVLYHNDDKTTFEFVISSLVAFFGKETHEAVEITFEIHKKGIGLAGIFSLEVAELKRDQVISAARLRKYPLHVSIEPA